MRQVCSRVTVPSVASSAPSLLDSHSSSALSVVKAAAEQGAHSLIGYLNSSLGKTAITKYFIELNQPPAYLP